MCDDIVFLITSTSVGPRAPAGRPGSRQSGRCSHPAGLGHHKSRPGLDRPKSPRAARGPAGLLRPLAAYLLPFHHLVLLLEPEPYSNLLTRRFPFPAIPIIHLSVFCPGQYPELKLNCPASLSSGRSGCRHIRKKKFASGCRGCVRTLYTRLKRLDARDTTWQGSLRPDDACHGICLLDAECQGKGTTDDACHGICLLDTARVVRTQSVKANVVRTTRATASDFWTQRVSSGRRVSRQMSSGRRVPRYLPSGRGVSGHSPTGRSACLTDAECQGKFLPDAECQTTMEEEFTC